MDRFEFQRQCVQTTVGKVLNVGCHVDPANLKAIDPGRVYNCDIAVQEGYDYDVDVFFDVREVWPFDNDSAEMVVFGDILEHLFDSELSVALSEAHRVAHRLCVTVPNDTHAETEDPKEFGPGYKEHCNKLDEEKIRSLLRETGWKIEDFQIVHYHVGPDPDAEGFLILASRA